MFAISCARNIEHANDRRTSLRCVHTHAVRLDKTAIEIASQVCIFPFLLRYAFSTASNKGRFRNQDVVQSCIFLGARAAAREGGSRCAATDMSAAACAALISSVILLLLPSRHSAAAAAAATTVNRVLLMFCCRRRRRHPDSWSRDDGPRARARERQGERSN